MEYIDTIRENVHTKGYIADVAIFCFEMTGSFSNVKKKTDVLAELTLDTSSSGGHPTHIILRRGVQRRL